METADWVVGGILSVLSMALGHLYHRTERNSGRITDLTERVAKSEGAIPEILKRIEGKLDAHMDDEDKKLDTLVALVKNGGRHG